MVQILVKIKEIFIYLTIKIINKKTIRHKIQTHTHKLPNIVFPSIKNIFLQNIMINFLY
jgi:hypothetical protein